VYTALRATSVTITQLLESRLRADPALGTLFDPGLGGTMEVSLRTPQEMREASQQGLSVWLYRVARDEQLLNVPPRRVSVDRLRPLPLPLRLHYLMSPIIVNGDNAAAAPALEQAVLGKVLQTFHDTPIVEGADLRDDLVGSGATLHVRLEPQGLEEITRVWDALEASYQLCVSYEVGVVLVESDRPDRAVSVVDVVAPETGVARLES
jgi:hypothetical protein